jgi:1,4-dihydroxy-2-naphthoate octaprenyltransferase
VTIGQMVKLILKLLHPIDIFLEVLTYSIGTGIAKYLGYQVNIVIFWMGMLAIITLFAVVSLLDEYFRFPIIGVTDRDQKRFKFTILLVSYAILAISAVCFLIIGIRFHYSISSLVLILNSIFLLLACALPPFRFSKSGFGELIMAIFLGTVLPIFSFQLQTGEFHRLLSFVTFPLTLLALAYLLIRNFSTFATDLKSGYHTLVHRLTWQWAVPIHHILILVAFLIFAIGPLVDIPWSLIWPVFLVLPFGVIQIIWLQRIVSGANPVWKLAIYISAATFGLTSYLLSLTFWTR